MRYRRMGALEPPPPEYQAVVKYVLDDEKVPKELRHRLVRDPSSSSDHSRLSRSPSLPFDVEPSGPRQTTSSLARRTFSLCTPSGASPSSPSRTGQQATRRRRSSAALVGLGFGMKHISLLHRAAGDTRAPDLIFSYRDRERNCDRDGLSRMSDHHRFGPMACRQMRNGEDGTSTVYT